MEGPLPERVQAQIAALYQKEGGNVFRTALLPAWGDRQVAEECVNDAFWEAACHWDRLESLDDEGRLAWLRTVARRRVIDKWRVKKQECATAHPELIEWMSERRPSTSLDVERIVLTSEALHRFYTVLMDMHRTKRTQARVAWLMLAEEWKTKEVATYLGIAESTVRVHLSNAKCQLRIELRDVIPFEPDNETPRMET